VNMFQTSRLIEYKCRFQRGTWKKCTTLVSAILYLCFFFIFPKMLFGAETVKEKDNAHVIFYSQNTTSEAGKIKAEALANYATGYLQIRSDGRFSDSSIQHLLSCVKKAPDAIPALKLLLANWVLDRDYKKIIDNLLPVAEKHPDALRINIIVADALMKLQNNNKAMLLLQNALSKTGYEQSTKPDIRLLIELIAKLSGIYVELEKIDEGEELWDNVLAHKQLREQLLLRMAAAAFFAEFADQGPDGFFAGWSKRRYRRKLDDNLSVIEQIYDQKHLANALLLLPLLKIYRRYSMPNKAENILLSMLLENPYNSSAMLMLAQSYSDFKQYSDSFRAWQVIIDSDRYKNAGRYWKYLTLGRGGEGDFYLELAQAALRGGNLKEAVRAFDWFLLLHPDDPEALFQLGITYMRLRNFTKAILKLERVKVLPEADFFRARCYMNENRPEKALAVMIDAEKTAQKNNRKNFLDDNFYIEYAFIADHTGDSEKAELIIKKLLKKSPDNPMLNNFLGYLWAEHGVNLDQSEKLIHKALEKDTENSAYTDSLAWVLFKKQKFKDALYYIEKALELEGDIPDAVIADHAGDIYHALNDKKNALKYWKIALAIYSENINRKSITDKIDQLRNSNFDNL
jgi:tetratricopeptide (TPR) repeat protein